MTRRFARYAATALMMAGLAVPLLAQAPASPADSLAGFARPNSFPDENKALVADYIARARKIAGDDLFNDFIHRCFTDQTYRHRANQLQYQGLLGPARVFDQLYFVGQNAVSSWALDTSEGIVLFDALNNADEARDILVPALQKMGLDPRRIRYVIITHSHGDHYGGADYLRQTYGAKLVSSNEDWAAMDAMRASGKTVGPFKLPPTRDIAVHDGEVMKVGNTALNFYVTPGHTPGTLSTIFKVTDGGTPHTVAFFGGFGSPRDPKGRYTLMASLDRFDHLVQAADADAMIANHALQESGYEKLSLLAYRRQGDPNPYVIGKDRVSRYFQVQVACNKVGLVRAGLDPEAR